MRPLPTLFAVWASAACAATPTQVRPDDMGADAHRRAAAQERAEAREHLRDWDAAPRKPTVAPALIADDDVYLDGAFWFDPRSWHLDEAQRHATRARDHEEAAAELEAFERQECEGVATETRNACYLIGPVSEIRDIDEGVYIRFAEGADTAAMAAHLRCHYAWARKQGFASAGGCPLDLAGVRFEAVGPAILVLGSDERTIIEIRRRARIQSTPAWRR